MAMKQLENSYGTYKQILMFPDHKIAYAHMFKKNDPLAVTVGDRKIVKAGTIFTGTGKEKPGIVENNIDVTDGDEAGAIIIHGFINTAKIPVAPTAAQLVLMPLIMFMNTEPITE